MPQNQPALLAVEGVVYMGENFLEECDDKYNRIVANPPFTKNQDIDHVMKMYECLLPGGKLVSITSEHWELSQNKKETEFREWLSEVNAIIDTIDKGAFKTSGTMVGGKIIIINKD